MRLGLLRWAMGKLFTRIALRRLIMGLILISMPVGAFLVSQRQWLLTVPEMSLVQIAPKRFLYAENFGYYEQLSLWSVPFIMEVRRRSHIPCSAWAAQTFDHEKTEKGMRVRTGCLLDAAPATPPNGMAVADFPGGMYVKLSRTEGGWPRVPVYRWLMERYAASNGKHRNGPLMEIAPIDIRRLNEITMLLPVVEVAER
jgi:hypothetical protein